MCLQCMTLPEPFSVNLYRKSTHMTRTGISRCLGESRGELPSDSFESGVRPFFPFAQLAILIVSHSHIMNAKLLRGEAKATKRREENWIDER